MKTAVLAVAHGTVDDLDDLPAFLTAIRRGRPAPPALLAEVRRRYEAIGGKSPLSSICAELTHELEARIGVPVRLAMRLWKPYPREVLAALAREGVERVVVLPLAQHSAHVYAESVEAAARALDSEGLTSPAIVRAPNWGAEPALTRAFTREIRRTLEETPPTTRARTALLLTAHSLPLAAIRGGDPYETEVRASGDAIVRELGSDCPATVHVAFQSQGMGGGEWLGPDLPTSLDALRRGGAEHVVVAPIGFLADHVEILYDLDLEAQELARARGLSLSRTRSLNATDGLVEALENVVRPLLE